MHLKRRFFKNPTMNKRCSKVVDEKSPIHIKAMDTFVMVVPYRWWRWPRMRSVDRDRANPGVKRKGLVRNCYTAGILFDKKMKIQWILGKFFCQMIIAEAVWNNGNSIKLNENLSQEKAGKTGSTRFPKPKAKRHWISHGRQSTFFWLTITNGKTWPNGRWLTS